MNLKQINEVTRSTTRARRNGTSPVINVQIKMSMKIKTHSERILVRKELRMLMRMMRLNMSALNNVDVIEATRQTSWAPSEKCRLVEPGLRTKRRLTTLTPVPRIATGRRNMNSSIVFCTWNKGIFKVPSGNSFGG